jgi:hypothetical protein
MWRITSQKNGMSALGFHPSDLEPVHDLLSRRTRNAR